MKDRIQSILLFLFCAILAASAADVDAIRTSVREGNGKLLSKKYKEGRTQLLNATKELEAHLKENPKDYKAAYELGMAFFYLDDNKRALESYALAAKLNPRIWQPWLFTGLIHSYANDFEKGEAAFLKASELAPRNADIWYELGMLYYEVEKDNESIAAFKKALAINPEHRKTSHELAFKHMDADESKKTYPFLAAKVAAQPNNPVAIYNFGQLCQNMGKTKESLEAFRKAIKLDSNDWRTLEKLIQLNQTLGNMEKRDTARQMVIDLRASGKVESLNEKVLFRRDQFKVAGQRISALEYFEMQGARAIRYSFVITDETGKSGKYRITLGSYDSTNRVATEVGDIEKGQRMFHLDGYYADGAHRTFNFFSGEPEYDTIKEQVVKILKGEKKSISSTTLTPSTD